MRNLRINMNLDQYEALTDLICFAYDNGFFSWRGFDFSFHGK